MKQRTRPAPVVGVAPVPILTQLAFAVAIGGGLVGCADVPPEVAERIDLAEVPSGADRVPSDLLPDPGPTGVTTLLQPLNESGVSAEVMAMETQDILVIVIEANGIPAPGEYPAWLVTGSCELEAEPAIMLDPVIGLQDGTGESTTTLGTDEIDRSRPLFVRVHGPGSVPLACGNLPAFSRMPPPSFP